MNSKPKEPSKRPLFNVKVKEEPIEHASSPASQFNDSSQGSQSSPQCSVKVKPKSGDKLNSMKKSLELNGKIRTILEHEITNMTNLLAINREKQTVLINIMNKDQLLAKSDKGLIQIRAISVFAAPYFRDIKKMVPPQNEDTLIKRKNHDVNAYLTPPRPWTPAEHQKLLDGITAYALLSALQPLKRNKNFIKRKMKCKTTTNEKLEEYRKELCVTEQKITGVNCKPLQVLMDELNDNIDWMTVSATNMQGVRTPEECEIMWNNVLSFNINKQVFLEEEDIKLADLAEDYKERNWDVIAAALKTNRTAIQCFERYQTRLSANLKKKYWTKEEDDHLIELVEEHKCGEVIPWNKISLLMEGRTRQQIINRYERSITQRYNRGPWSPEEDGLLIGLCQKYGTRWNKMKGFFKRRSVYAIRERYCNALTPNIRVGPWSLDEDKLLISMIRKCGYGRWAKICRKLPGRTDNMCLMRAGRLLEWSVKYHSERGTGEYDPGVNDPEMFARILRPCAPSKYCPIRNERLRSYRENGLKMLVKQIEKIAPEYKAGIHDLNSVDVSWMSSEMLHRLSDALHESISERTKYEKENPIPPLKYITKPPLKRKRGESESDEDDYFRPPDPVVPREEKDLVDAALYAMFQMHGDIMQPSIRKTTVFGTRQCAEMSLYKAYLYKQFHCKALCDKDDDLENVVFAKVDYRETLQTVVSYFIQPPVYENQFIVLTPNLTTMTGMEAIQATENRLLSMSELTSHSKPYIDYLCERRKYCPKCLQCLHRSGKTTENVTPDTIMSEMKKKSFLLDERLKQSAYVEGASVEQLSGYCTCKALADSQKSVQLLRKRFLSLFMWPALFSSAEFNKEQERIICTERAKDDNYFFNMSLCPMEDQGFKVNLSNRKRKGSSSKRKYKKRIVSVHGTKPKQAARSKPVPCRKKPSPPAVRRSSRSCVVNRPSYTFQEHKTRKSRPTTDHEVSVPENMSDGMISDDEINDGSSEENNMSTLQSENRNNVLLLQEDNRDNASSLQGKNEKCINDIPALPDDSSDNVSVLQEDSTDSVLLLPSNDKKSASQNKREENKKNEKSVNDTPALPEKVRLQIESRDNVLALHGESSDSVVILPEKNGENSSTMQDDKEGSAINIPPSPYESSDGILELHEMSRDSVVVLSEESGSGSPESLCKSSENDSVITVEEKDRSPVTPEEVTISSDSSVSCDQFHKSESGAQQTVSNCVLELTEKNICFK